MTTLTFANNAVTTLAGAITNTATSAQLAAGSGALFPSLGAGEIFKMTFTDAATGLLNEIVNVTGISTDTITMVRGQEGTTAKAWSAGDNAANLLTAGSMEAFAQGDGSSFVTGSELTATLASYVTSSALTTALGSYVTSSALTSTLAGYVTNSTLATDLALYPLLTSFVQNLSGSQWTKEFPPLGGVNFTFKLGQVSSTTGNGDVIAFDSPFATLCEGVICQEAAPGGWAGNPTIVAGSVINASTFGLYTMKAGIGGVGHWGYTGGISGAYIAWGY